MCVSVLVCVCLSTYMCAQVYVCYWAPKTPVVVSSLGIVEKSLPTELYHSSAFVFLFGMNIADPNDLCCE